jgi:hypothetical protein
VKENENRGDEGSLLLVSRGSSCGAEFCKCRQLEREDLVEDCCFIEEEIVRNK